MESHSEEMLNCAECRRGLAGRGEGRRRNRLRGALSMGQRKAEEVDWTPPPLRAEVLGANNGEGAYPVHRTQQMINLRRWLTGRRLLERLDEISGLEAGRCRGPLLIGQGDSKTRHSIPNELRSPSQINFLRQRAAGSRIPVAVRNFRNN